MTREQAIERLKAAQRPNDLMISLATHRIYRMIRDKSSRARKPKSLGRFAFPELINASDQK
jgi:hypothetical protein